MIYLVVNLSFPPSHALRQCSLRERQIHNMLDGKGTMFGGGVGAGYESGDILYFARLPD